MDDTTRKNTDTPQAAPSHPSGSFTPDPIPALQAQSTLPPPEPSKTNPHAHPVVYPVQWENIPRELQVVDRWVLWAWIWVGSKWQKPPKTLDAYGNVVGASTTNPAHWLTYEAAKAAVEAGKAHGVGFVLHVGEGEQEWVTVGVDLDDCLDAQGNWTPEAAAVIQRHPTYTEVSPSGTGAKLLFLAREKLPGRGLRHEGKNIEVYCDGRYFVVTGRVLPDEMYRGLRRVNGEINDFYRELKADMSGLPPGVEPGAPQGWEKRYQEVEVPPLPAGWDELEPVDWFGLGWSNTQQQHLEEGGSKAGADDRSAMDYSVCLSALNRLGDDPPLILRCLMEWCPDASLERRSQDWYSAADWMWKYTVWPAVMQHRHDKAVEQQAMAAAMGLGGAAGSPATGPQEAPGAAVPPVDGSTAGGGGEGVDTLPRDRDGLCSAAGRLAPGDRDGLKRLLMHLASLRLDAVDEDDVLQALKQQAAVSVVVLRKMMKTLRRAAFQARAGGEGVTPKGARLPERLQEKLAYDESGKIRRSMANLGWICCYHPDWVDVLVLDEFKGEVLKQITGMKGYLQPGPWRDLDTTVAQMWIEATFEVSFPKDMVDGAVAWAAAQNSVHVVRDWLGTLTWDGQPRLCHLLPWYFGATGESYAAEIGTRFMISAVARVMEPGCKVDTVLCVSGNQGYRKSTGFQVLFSEEWFLDSQLDLRHNVKDAYQSLQGNWCIELAEMTSLHGASAHQAKTFFSSATDKYRPSYGRHQLTVPRQCVVVATGNDTAYLKDLTGNRRYWPVESTRPVNLERLHLDRDQLWAEAVHLYRQRHKWWVDVEDEIYEALKQGQDRRVVVPEGTDAVQDALNLLGNPAQLTMSSLMIPLGRETKEVLDVRVTRPISLSLKFLGYDRKHTENGNVWMKQ